MKRRKLSAAEQQRLWFWMIITASVAAAAFLRPYWGVIILAALVAYIFLPLQHQLESKLPNKSAAVALTATFSVLIILIPLLAIFIVAVSQGLQLINDLNLNALSVGGSNLESQILSITERINVVIENLTGLSNSISNGSVISFLETTLPNVLRTVVDSIVGIISGIPSFFTNLIIYLFVFCSLLFNRDEIARKIKEISPFDTGINTMYAQKVGLMAKAMVKGQMLIAIAQGIVSAAVVSLVGFGGYFWFMAVLFSLLSFIPLGAGIITIPLSIILALFGNIAGGILILLNHFIVVTNIDNYIRPKVVPEGAQLSSTLTILGAFAGVYYFGIVGVVYGPIIMIVLVSTLDAYLEQTT